MPFSPFKKLDIVMHIFRRLFHMPRVKSNAENVALSPQILYNNLRYFSYLKYLVNVLLHSICDDLWWYVFLSHGFQW